jgi:predicted histone-like DNA-binding protein
MTVSHIAVQRSNPEISNALKRFYARIKNRVELMFRKLNREIAEGFTTVSDIDVLVVLNDLIKVSKRHLDNGEIVRFGDFGTFQVGVTSEGMETEEKFHSSFIKNLKVVFRPRIGLKEMLATLKYEKINEKIIPL